MKFLLAAVALLGVQVQAVPFSEYILAPQSRTIHPAKVHKVNGTVLHADHLLEEGHGTARFEGISSVTLDFGKNIAGVVSLAAGSSSTRDAIIWLTYTESSVWINGNGSDSTADAGLDAPLPLHVGHGPGPYKVDRDHERGGFRYLSLISNTSACIDLTQVSVYFTAAPSQNLREYAGYFHSNDELLNRIWYAGAYTTQLASIDPNHGNALVLEGINTDSSVISLPQTDIWYNNLTISNGTSVLTDGAKRDRLLYAGDMAISLPSAAYSTYDLYSGKNALEALYVLQLANGRLPYTGLPFSDNNATSFTYHLHTLFGTYNYYQFSGDRAWLQDYWRRFKRGVDWSLGYIDSSGLMNVTASSDWLRKGMGGHNIEANALLVFVLNRAVELAETLGDEHAIFKYSKYATSIKDAANKLLWDPSANLFIDNETTTLHPQDGNSIAVLADLSQSNHQKSAVVAALKARWGKYGAPAPEVDSIPATISPFIGGFELQAHFLAGDALSALELMRRQWGFMLNDGRMTNSTFIEGYSADGSLHYAPYPNDPRVSHAHGWSAGPTSALSRFVTGLEFTGAAGKTWKIAPMLGDLESVQGGLTTSLGAFSVAVECRHGRVAAFSFKTPPGTHGQVVLPGGTEGVLKSGAWKQKIWLADGKATGVPGGEWTLHIKK